MECIIDCRENKILDKLKESNKFAFLVHQLDLGDIIIKNGIRKLIIERKTWDDLKSSLMVDFVNKEADCYYRPRMKKIQKYVI